MIKVILIAALVIAATATACTGTYAECATCTTPDASEVCATCSTGFSLPATDMCHPASCTNYIANCDSCAIATPLVCETCSAGYIYDSTNSVCVSCSDATTGYTGNFAGCDTCTVDASKALTCTGCSTMEGYSWDGESSACVNCATGVNSGGFTYTAYLPTCATCSATSSKVLTCDTCLAGYALDTTNIDCVSCSTGKTAASAGTYTGMVTNCGTCAFAANGPSRILQTGVTALVCSACATGYTWDLTNSACASCSAGTGTSVGGTAETYTGITANCGACTVDVSKVLTCSGCATGYAWDATNLACASCVTGAGTSTGATAYAHTGFNANCASCTATTSTVVCIGCNSAYYLNFDNTCVSGTGLDTNCEHYAANPGHCVQCMGSLTHTASNACVACPSNCDVCNLAGTTCSVCNTGYELSTTTTGTCKTSGANIIMPGFALLSIIFYYLF